MGFDFQRIQAANWGLAVITVLVGVVWPLVDAKLLLPPKAAAVEQAVRLAAEGEKAHRQSRGQFVMFGFKETATRGALDLSGKDERVAVSATLSPVGDLLLRGMPTDAAIANGDMPGMVFQAKLTFQPSSEGGAETWKEDYQWIVRPRRYSLLDLF